MQEKRVKTGQKDKERKRICGEIDGNVSKKRDKSKITDMIKNYIKKDSRASRLKTEVKDL